MLKKAGLLIFILTFYTLFLVILMPVNILVHHVSLPKTISIDQLKGSFFSGKASHIVVNGLSVSNVDWRLIWSNGLPALRLNVTDDVNNIDAEGVVHWYKSWNVQDVQIRFPIDRLFSILNQVVLNNKQLSKLKGVNNFLAQPINLSGNMKLNIQNGQFSFAKCISLNANLTWLDANIDAFGIPIDLERLEAQLKCVQNKLLIEISQNSVQLKSHMTVSVDVKTGAYEVNGNLFAQPELPPSLGLLLKTLPVEPNDESYRVTLRGNL